MAKQRFAAVGVTRLDLSDGDWIEIKTELNYGDVQTLRLAALRPIQVQEGMGRNSEMTVHLDPYILQQKTIELYLLDWSLRDANDKPVPCNRNMIRALDRETADEILAVIQQHERDHEAKKTTGGEKK